LVSIKRVLLASPICKKYEILKPFLETIVQQEAETIQIDYLFIDDNQDSNSSDLLHSLKDPRVLPIQKAPPKAPEQKYEDGDYTHNWNEYLVWRLAEIKNSVILLAREQNYDYLFFVDSDLILNPKTVEHLVSLQLDIVSEVFWTKWTPDQIALPQVWLYDHYGLVPKGRTETIDQKTANERFSNFIYMLQRPGVYAVGGLGACTLISKHALDKGVSFSEIYNISFWGEDRAFCIRAAVLGLPLHADTRYPPLHLYRDVDLEKLEEFKRNNGLC
jgi:hypothetical protein